MSASAEKSWRSDGCGEHRGGQSVQAWCGEAGQVSVACGVEPCEPRQGRIGKDFSGAAGGSGRAFERDWLTRAGLAALPQWLSDYRGELHLAAQRDVVAHPVEAALFKDKGFEDLDV